MADSHPDGATNPPPLTVAAAVVGVQGLVLLVLAVVEGSSVVSSRAEVAISTAVFFGLYGVLLLVCAVALTRRAGWARGPVLLSALIQLGIAWNVRDVPLLAIVLAVAAAVVIAGMVSKASIEALDSTS